MTGLPEGAALRPGLETVHFDCDTLVFDVDGVLVDVRESFREVIRATAAGVQRLMAVSVPWTPARDDITLFKRAGGFNDDIEMSIAMTAIGAGGRGGDVARLAQAVEDAGGGLRALRAVAPELPRIDGQVVLRFFSELYYGTTVYQRLYGHPVVHTDSERGLMERERALVARDLPDRVRAQGVRHLGVITGRSPQELEIALERLGWPATALNAVVTGDMVRKPDPTCLDTVVAACHARALVYVGDVRDDWELVRRYRDERDTGAEVRCILVGEDIETAVYRRLGVDATVRRTEDVLTLLRAWRAATGG